MEAPDTHSPDPLLGTFAGNFQIASLIGNGGMGAVYAAVHPTLGRFAAIKVLAAEYASQPELVARFTVEAQTVARLHHPNIVEVLDFGTLADGRPFFAMERLFGEPLRAWMQRNPHPDIAHVAAIFTPILEALAAAHQAGIIHRDIKPDNVFLHIEDDRFVPKLLDFGIAKLTSWAPTHRTATGVLVGTPAYMSPEQASGQNERVGATSDLYAIAVMAYETFTGRLPFAAKHLGELIRMHLVEQPPPLAQLRPDVPPSIANLIDAALAKEPQARPASAQQMRAVWLPFATAALHADQTLPPIDTAVKARVTPGDARVDASARTEMGRRPQRNGADSAAPPQTLPAPGGARALAADSEHRRSARPTAKQLPDATQPPRRQSDTAANAPLPHPRSGKRWLVATAVASSVISAGVVFAVTQQRNRPSAAPTGLGIPLKSTPSERGKAPVMTSVADSVHTTRNGASPSSKAEAPGGPHVTTTPNTLAPGTTPTASESAPTPTSPGTLHNPPPAAGKSKPRVGPASVTPASPTPPATPITRAGAAATATTSPAPANAAPPAASTTSSVQASVPSPGAPTASQREALTQLMRSVADAQTTGDYATALRHVEAALAIAPTPALHFQAALLACQAQKPAVAKQHYPLVTDPQMRAGLEQGCLRLARIYLNDSLKGSATDRQLQAQDLYMAGVAEASKGDFARAAVVYEQAAMLSPDGENHAAWRAADAGCRLQDARLVARMWPRVPPRLHSDVEATCRRFGTPVPASANNQPAP